MKAENVIETITRETTDCGHATLGQGIDNDCKPETWAFQPPASQRRLRHHQSIEIRQHLDTVRLRRALTTPPST